MNYTEIPQSFKENYKTKFQNINPVDIQKLAEQDPVIFGYSFIGKKVRLHQAFIMDKFVSALKRGHIRLAMCLARQLGKTVGGAILLVWLCWYNKMPVTIANLTIWYVVSRDDETAVEFLEKIRLLLWDGDRHMSKYSEIDNFFTGSLKEPNNTHQLTFLNNCFIKSIPPTKKALGKSASGLWIDEAHRLNCMDIDSDTFFDYASAMVAETGGAIVLSSSPEGITGFFSRAIDPNKQYPENEFESVWFPHYIWNDESEECKRYKAFIESERIRLTAAGRLRYWQQEYLALFTVTETSFFEHVDIENSIKDTAQIYEWRETLCSLGIDYGITNARTVLTIRTEIKGELIQLFQHRCEAGFDINNLINQEWEHSIQNLKKRYNLFMIIPDDCASGDSTNRWMEQNSGVQVKKYNFRSDQMSKQDGINRNCAAYSYRARLKEGTLKIPKWNTIQQYEMKIIQETEQKVLISIKAPQGQLCDTFDSDMMACIPFLDMQLISDFQVDIPKDEEIKPNPRNPRADNSGFKKMTDEECQQLLKDANAGLIQGWD